MNIEQVAKDIAYGRWDDIEENIFKALSNLEAEKNALREQILILGKAKQVCEKENKALCYEIENWKRSSQEDIKHIGNSANEINSLRKRIENSEAVNIQIAREDIISGLQREVSDLRSQLNQYQSKTVNVVKFHRMEDEIESLRKSLSVAREEAYDLFTAIRDCHMSCEQPTEQEEREVHQMFHLAEKGIQKFASLSGKENP